MRPGVFSTFTGCMGASGAEVCMPDVCIADGTAPALIAAPPGSSPGRSWLAACIAVEPCRRLVGGAVAQPADRRAGLLVLLEHLHVDVEHVADEVVLDDAHHRLEHVEALALPLGERVLLTHGPEVDALLEVVHLVEVLAPALVDHGEHHAPFDLAPRVVVARLSA